MKPTLLIFTHYYLPGFHAGGPLRSISNICERLSGEFDFFIVTSDRDIGAAEAYPNTAIECWLPVGNAMVRYMPPEAMTYSRIARVLRDTPHDLLYLNSFFDFRFTQLPLYARFFGSVPKKPVVIAPRGEFSRGALAIKRFKKAVFLSIIKRFPLYAGMTWQASSAKEADDIRAALRTNDGDGDGDGDKFIISVNGNISIAPDLVSPIGSIVRTETPGHPRKNAELQVCFLSRISPIKNLDYALSVLGQVTARVCFHIYGPVEDASYWARCQSLIRALPDNIKIEIHGGVSHGDIAATLSSHDLFFFPTHGENFGHVILEALSAGLPLLISDQTPWNNLQSKRIGWDLPLNDMSAFVQCLEGVYAMPGHQLEEMRRCAIEYSREVASDHKTEALNVEMFRGALLRFSVGE